MSVNFKLYLQAAVTAAIVFLSSIAQGVPVDYIAIGTWNVAPGSGNPGGANGGPVMAVGQRFVVKVGYESTSTIITNDGMDKIELTGGSNTIDIFVPMEGLDSGTPFIYTQDESTHFFAFIPEPTLNFTLGSNRSDTSNIVGFEFEGDFAPSHAMNQNIIEIFNTPSGAQSVSQILNCQDDFCASSAIAITSSDGFAEAVPVMVGNDAVTYSASTLLQTSNLAFTSNDLGAARSDGETFLDATWTESGGPLSGTVQANDVDIAVAIEHSGLTTTTSTSTWDIELSEEMTGLSDTGEVLVDYANATPSSTLSATANATPGYDFAYTFDDLDLAINALITGFEQLAFSVLVDGLASTVFDDLVSLGLQTLTNGELFTAFGAGLHGLDIMVTDLAGAMFTSSATFTVTDVQPPTGVPVPNVIILMGLGLAILALQRRRKLGQ